MLPPIPITLFRAGCWNHLWPGVLRPVGTQARFVHLLVGKCFTWVMGYVAAEANKRISCGGEENNVCVEWIPLHVATDVWKRAGLAESMYQKDLLLFAEGSHSLSCFDICTQRGNIGCPSPPPSLAPVTNSTINLHAISFRANFTFLIFNIAYK